MFAGTNWLGVIICVVVAIAVGFVWYSRFLFLNPWLAGIGKGPEFVQRPNPMNYVIMIVTSFVVALFLDALIRIMGSTGAAGGFLAGVIVWIGFVASTSASNAAFGGRGWKVWGIEAGNHLVTLVLMGIILSVMAQ